MPRTLTDAERIASIREVITATQGDWHEATALLSIGTDLHWLLARAEAATPAPDERLRAALDAHRGALVTVAQWDSWASEWLAKHPLDEETV